MEYTNSDKALFLATESEGGFLEADDARSLLFNKILEELAASSLFSNSARAPSIFIVYAHDNIKDGVLYDGYVRNIINWLGKIHARILSDQSPLPPFKHRLENDNAIRNILANQLCLLPPALDRDGVLTATSVDNVIVCGSEVLEQYYSRPSALDYIRNIVQICTDGLRQSMTTLHPILHAQVETFSNKDDFHHIFTELAFLEVRKHVFPEAHGMIPLQLSQIDAGEAPMRYMPMFDNTDIKLKLDSLTFTSLHKLFFKLLEQLYPEDRDFIRPFRESYYSINSTLEPQNYSKVTPGRFEVILGRGISEAYRKYSSLSGAFVRDLKFQASSGIASYEVSRVLSMLSQEIQDKILDWLSPISPTELHGKYHDLGTSRLHGTCNWIIKDQEFCRWHSSKGSALIFLYGNMGTGKTYATSRVVDWVMDHLSAEKHDEGFAYFYCNKQDNRRSEPKEILRNIIRQLATGPWKANGSIKGVHREVHDFWENAQKLDKGSTFHEWKDLLLSLIGTYPKTTIVLDALDECEKKHLRDFIDLFVALGSVQSETNSVKIFLSLRSEEDLLRHFDKHPGFPAIRTQAKHNAHDIAIFVRTKISEHRKWSKMPENFRSELIETLLVKTGDMFLFASLQIDHLLDCKTQPALRNCLAKLPDSLERTYKDIYQNATSDPDERTLLDRALQWVLSSVRPLSTDELVLAICQSSESNAAMPRRQDVDEEVILDLCHNLLILDTGFKPPVWRFTHQAVVEFLLKNTNCNYKAGHHELGKVCLMILDEIFHKKISQKRGERVSQSKKDDVRPCRLKKRPHRASGYSLAKYAILAWPTHFREACKTQQTGHFYRTLEDFLGDPEKGSVVYKRWRKHSNHLVLSKMSPISLACYLGFYHILSEGWGPSRLDQHKDLVKASYFDLMERGLDTSPMRNRDVFSVGSITWVQSWDWSLVALASAHDHSKTVKCLLDRGAAADAWGEYEVPPILVAILAKSVESRKELLQLREVCSREDVLHFVFRMDLLDLLKPMIDRGLSGPRDLENFLAGFPCGYFKSADAITVLLDIGVNANAHLRHGTLLAAAAYHGWEGLVKRLLNQGADVNAQFEGREFRNALEAAVQSYGTLSIANLLLKHGARITAKVVESVHRWHPSKYETLRQLFGQSPAMGNLNETYEDGIGNEISALIATVKLQRTDDVRFLTQHGADVNLKVGVNFQNALSAVFWAALEDNFQQLLPDATRNIIEVLVEAGASFEGLEGEHMNTALAGAAFAGLDDMVQSLLALGANPDAICKHAWLTALGAAVASKRPGAPRIVRTLLGYSADINLSFPESVNGNPSDKRYAIDIPFYLLIALDSEQDDCADIWFHSASLLLSHGAIWDLNFAQWRYCLERQLPEFCQRNHETLDQMLVILRRNRISFFTKNPEAASQGCWRVKHAGDPDCRDRVIARRIRRIIGWFRF